MAPKPTPRKHHHAPSLSSSSSSEDEVSSGDEQVMPPQTKNPTAPPEGSEGSDEEESEYEIDDDEESEYETDDEEEEMAYEPPPKVAVKSTPRKAAAAPPAKVAAKSTPRKAAAPPAEGSESDEIQESDGNAPPAKVRAKTAPRKGTAAPAEGSGKGEDGVVTLGPTKEAPLQGEKISGQMPPVNGNVVVPKASRLKRDATAALKRKAEAAQLIKSPPPKKKPSHGNADTAAVDLARSRLRKRTSSPIKVTPVAATKSAPPKKRAASNKVPSPKTKTAAGKAVMDVASGAKKVPAAAATAEVPAAIAAGEEQAPPQPQEGAYDAEKLLEEKSTTRPFVWHMVQTMEKDQSRAWKNAFVKLKDADAEALDTDIKDLYVRELKGQLEWLRIYGSYIEECVEQHQ